MAWFVRATFLVSLTVIFALKAEGESTIIHKDCSGFIDIYDSPHFTYQEIEQEKIKIEHIVADNDFENASAAIWFGVPTRLFNGTPYETLANRIEAARSLIIAAARNDLAAITRLVRRGAQVNVIPRQDAWMPPIVWAARCGHLNAVTALLSAGAEPNLGGYVINDVGIAENSTALRWAATSGSIEVMRLLLHHGADPNTQETVIRPGQPVAPGERRQLLYHSATTPLISAVSFTDGNCEAGKLLLMAGADPNMMEEDGRSALIWATLLRKRDCVRSLLDAGADAAHADLAGMDALAGAGDNDYIKNMLQDSLRK